MAEDEDAPKAPDRRIPSHRSLNGKRLTSLKALQKLVAASLLDAPPERRASLVKEMRAIVAEIDGLTLPVKRQEPVKERDDVDELAERRARRRGDPTPGKSGAEGQSR